MKKFDLAIIGGGAGAFAAAIRADELGAKTVMVNHGLPLGGTCVNVGCVPSKTLLWAGEVMHQAKSHGIPGIELTAKRFDFQTVVQDELALVERLRREKYEKVLGALDHVELIEGEARFVSSHEVTVGARRLRGEKFVIATGSTATVPLIEGIQDVGFLTHVDALKLETQPKELLVVGAGPLGLEFAQMYARFGTKVTILQKGPSIFPPAEPELTERLAEILTAEDITIHRNTGITRAVRAGNKKTLRFTVDGEKKRVSGDEILLATGKTPNTQDLGLDPAGVKVDDRHAIVVSTTLQTAVPHIYAVGDVTNLPLRLETTAGREGTLAAENSLTGSQHSIDYTTVPYTIFTDPQLAGVGLTEAQEMKQLGRCACRTVSFSDVPKALITRRTEGLIKMAIHPKTKVIMGVHLLAPNAGDLIAQAMLLIKNKNTIDDVVNSLPVFPTMSEAIKIVALSFTKDISKLSCCV